MTQLQKELRRKGRAVLKARTLPHWRSDVFLSAFRKSKHSYNRTAASRIDVHRCTARFSNSGLGTEVSDYMHFLPYGLAFPEFPRQGV